VELDDHARLGARKRSQNLAVAPHARERRVHEIKIGQKAAQKRHDFFIGIVVGLLLQIVGQFGRRHRCFLLLCFPV